MINHEECASTSLENDPVGDERKTNEQHIACECQPNATGAAVPVIPSLNEVPLNYTLEQPEPSKDHSLKVNVEVQEPEIVKKIIVTHNPSKMNNTKRSTFTFLCACLVFWNINVLGCCSTDNEVVLNSHKGKKILFNFQVNFSSSCR